MKGRKLLKMFLCVVILLGMVVAVQAGTRGVSKNQIVVGTHTALSGPVAGWGIDATNGVRMRFDEANEAGGIYGRKIKYIVEDSQYRVPIAVQKANKLVNRDKAFFSDCKHRYTDEQCNLPHVEKEKRTESVSFHSGTVHVRTP